MSCASFSSARPAIRRACSSEVSGSFVLRCSTESVARAAGVSNGHGPADAIGRLPGMTTDQKGAIAEAAIAFEAVKLGLDVYRPMSDGGRCDLILGFGYELMRVQCKWAALHGSVLIVRCYTFRRTGTGWKKTTYSREEVDVIGAYSHGARPLLPDSGRNGRAAADHPATDFTRTEQPKAADQLGRRLRFRSYTGPAQGP